MRVYNFSAGPSMLPVEVLQEAGKSITDYNGSGMSVMEMSHRSKWYDAINTECLDLVRELMQIPENYHVIMVQGGAATQFEAIPLNLLKTGKADYIVTGNFAKKAYKEAQKYGDIRLVASSEDKKFTYIPKTSPSDFRQDASYVHITENNTIFGSKYHTLPDTNGVPLVADLSSCIMSEKTDVSKYSLIYAGAQKNLAPAGVTLVIVKDDMLGGELPICPTMLKYRTQIDANSSTPPSATIRSYKRIILTICRAYTNDVMCRIGVLPLIVPFGDDMLPMADTIIDLLIGFSLLPLYNVWNSGASVNFAAFISTVFSSAST